MKKNNKIKNLKWTIHPIYLFAGKEESKESYSCIGPDIKTVSDKLKEKGCQIKIIPTKSTYYISILQDSVMKRVFRITIETVH